MKKILVAVVAFLSSLSVLYGCLAKPAPGSPGSPGSMIVDPAQPKCLNSVRPSPSPINPYISKDPPFGPWIAHHDRYMKRQWEAKPFKRAVTCQVTVSKAGNVSDVQVTKSSGSPDDDKAAIELITKSGPFRPLPASFALQKQAFLVQFRGFPTVFLSKVN